MMALSKLLASSLLVPFIRGECRIVTSCKSRRFHKAGARRPLLKAMAVAGEDPAVKSVVMYHYPCPDGVFGALAAHLYHSAIACPVQFLPNSVFDPLRVQDLSVEGVEVFYLVDFAGPEGFAVELSHKAKQVVVLDHHKTALETLPRNGEGPKNLHCVLDMNRSGATIAYEYFQEKLQSTNTQQSVGLVKGSNFERVKDLFKYIEDGDLWRWCLQDSKAFSSGLNDIGLEFNALTNPGIFGQLLALDARDLIIKGKETLKAKQAVIDAVLSTSFVLALGGGTYGQCLGVRADDTAHLRSELGNQLATKSFACGLLGKIRGSVIEAAAYCAKVIDTRFSPIGAVVYVQPGFEGSETKFKVSLRSIGESADTTPVSQAFGGGGHRNASGFLISRDTFEQWKV